MLEVLKPLKVVTMPLCQRNHLIFYKTQYQEQRQSFEELPLLLPKTHHSFPLVIYTRAIPNGINRSKDRYVKRQLILILTLLSPITMIRVNFKKTIPC